ncbi:glycosyltransferase [Synechococcus sp. AH-601-N10]|nr:glycosyltransferase [Synechococcus sp. AH-601-N10]
MDNIFIRFLCLPDVDRPIGGVKQLYRHVEHLCALGWNAAVVTEIDGFMPDWFVSSAPTIGLSKCWENDELRNNNCILVLPETYIGVNLRDFRGYDLSSIPRVVFNQNAYYTYGGIQSDSDLLDSFYDSPCLLHVLSISEDTHRFLHRNVGISDSRLSRIVNAIESSFRPDIPKENRMHWMPRKNPDHVCAIIQGLKRCHIPHISGWKGYPLVGLSHLQVAEHLNRSRIFLSFGHPEGFGLPIAEAMASGCWVVGYSGGGGRELFRYGASDEVTFGDWPGFIAALERTFLRFVHEPEETAFRLQRQALAIKSLYSVEQERESIRVAWARIYSAFNSLLQSSSPVL